MPRAIDKSLLARTLACFRAIEEGTLDLSPYAGEYVALVVRRGKVLVGSHDANPGRIFWDIPQEDVALIVPVSAEGQYLDVEPLSPAQRARRERKEDLAGA